MANIRRILCPVDFSPGSEAALTYAVDLSKRLDASVDVLHVYQLPVYALPDGALLPGPEFTVRLTRDVQDALEELSVRHGEGRVETHMQEGIPHLVILEKAAELEADLIVMGTHGRTGLERFLVGSVAERVVRTSPVPVVTVPLGGGS